MTVPPTPPILENPRTDPRTDPEPGERDPRWAMRPTLTRAIVLIAAIAAVALLGQLVSGGTSETPAPDADSPVVVDPAPDDDADTVGLPNAVAVTAAQIEEAALAEDWDRLAELAMAGGTPFTASLGEELTTAEELAAYWRGLATEEDLPRIIAALISLEDWAETTTTDDASGAAIAVHVTPRFMHEPTDEARSALEEALGREWLDLQIADGEYLGWRIGITARGDWIFLVQGG